MSDDDRVQLYRLRGKWVIRTPPSTPPTDPQRRAREAFAEAAREARGRKRESADPPAAVSVASALTGRSFGGTAKVPRWKILIMQVIVRRGYSVEEAAAIVAAIPD